MVKFDFIYVVLLFLIYFVSFSSSEDGANEDQSKSHMDEINLYQTLFKIKRKEHLAVVQKLILIEDIAKLASFLQVTFDKIIEVWYDDR